MYCPKCMWVVSSVWTANILNAHRHAHADHSVHPARTADKAVTDYVGQNYVPPTCRTCNAISSDRVFIYLHGEHAPVARRCVGLVRQIEIPRFLL